MIFIGFTVMAIDINVLIDRQLKLLSFLLVTIQFASQKRYQLVKGLIALRS